MAINIKLVYGERGLPNTVKKSMTLNTDSEAVLKLERLSAEY